MTSRVAGLILASAFISPTDVSAQSMDVLYVQPMGGVYTQTWSGRAIGQDPSSQGILVMLHGDGKAGSFYGVLSVNCATPTLSEWVAHGGYLTVDRVPTETIIEMRRKACATG